MITFMEMSLLGEESRTPSVSCCCSSVHHPHPRGCASLPHQALLTPRPLFGHSAFVSSGRLLPCPCVLAQMLSWLLLSLHPELGELRGAWACGIAVQIHYGL